MSTPEERAELVHELISQELEDKRIELAVEAERNLNQAWRAHSENEHRLIALDKRVSALLHAEALRWGGCDPRTLGPLLQYLDANDEWQDAVFRYPG